MSGKALNAALYGTPINAMAAKITNQAGCSDSFELSFEEKRTKARKELEILKLQRKEIYTGRDKKAILSICNEIRLKEKYLASIKTQRKYTTNHFFTEACSKILDKSTFNKVISLAKEMAEKANEKTI